MAELISVCMAAHNRKRQLQNTLRAIQWHSKDLPVEVVIVDDNSDETFTRAELNKYKLPITYKIRKDRTRQDPVIPNNMAFDMAKGDIFIMSCGEILMVENVLQHAWNNVNNTNYFCYGVYSFGWSEFGTINMMDWNNRDTLNLIKDMIDRLSVGNYTAGYSPGWYIHSTYRPVPLPFCASLSRNNMEKLSGYDESFQHGVGHADDDFLRRIYDLRLSVSIVDAPVVVHQPHLLTDYSDSELVNYNLRLYNENEKKHNIKSLANIYYVK